MNIFTRLLSCIFLVLLMLGFVILPASAQSYYRPNYDDVDYYDCSSKEDGNYNHPTDMTRFITCHNGRASDQACPSCDVNNVALCAGSAYLVFDLSKNQCNYPSLLQSNSSSSFTTLKK